MICDLPLPNLCCTFVVYFCYHINSCRIASDILLLFSFLLLDRWLQLPIFLYKRIIILVLVNQVKAEFFYVYFAVIHHIVNKLFMLCWRLRFLCHCFIATTEHLCCADCKRNGKLLFVEMLACVSPISMF